MKNCQSLLDKEVINIRDGCRMGCVCDILVNVKLGTVAYIIVPIDGGFFSFSQKNKNNFCFQIFVFIHFFGNNKSIMINSYQNKGESTSPFYYRTLSFTFW